MNNFQLVLIVAGAAVVAVGSSMAVCGILWAVVDRCENFRKPFQEKQ